MPTASYYREQARLLRSMAEGTEDFDLAARYRRRADEYNLLANSMPDDETSFRLKLVSSVKQYLPRPSKRRR